MLGESYMWINQPPVKPLPAGISLQGKTAIVTGSTAGIGQETARQLLILKIDTVILAVRNLNKGENVKELLLSDAAVKTHSRSANVKVMKLDMDDYRSIKDFTMAVKLEVPMLDLLVLNAGIATVNFELGPAGHERVIQVNYLSNIMLLLELLPLLEATATKTGSPSRVTWLGSRRHYKSSLASTKPFEPGSTVLAHFDNKDNFSPILRYGDSKCLCTMFMYEFAKRISREKIIVNMLCPGMVYTEIGNFLPLPLRVLFHAVHMLFARSVEDAGCLVVNAAAVVGPESHGEFLLDKDIQA